MAGNIPFHPAPGTANGGELPPGFFAVQNTPAAHAAYGVTRSRGIAEIIPATWTIPENPVRAYVSGNWRPLGQGDCGGGCGGGGGCSCHGGSLNGIGVGDLATDWNAIQANITAGNWGAAAQGTVYGFPLWGIAAAVVGLLMLSGGRR